MSLALEKGERLNLTKESGGAQYFVVGLGWTPAGVGNADFDLDASAILLGADGKPVGGEAGFIFFNQLVSPTVAGVRSMGDNLTGDGAGDDEQIVIDLAKLDARVEKIDVVVTIFKAAERHQNFGQVKDAYIRIGTGTQGSDGNPVMADGKVALTPIKQFDLSEDFSAHTAVHMGSLYKKDGEWRFQAVGLGLGKAEIGNVFEQYAPGAVAHG